MAQGNRIAKVKKDGNGDITNVMLQDGSVYPLDEAIRLAAKGSIEGVNVGRSKNGTEYLRSNPDGDVSNNLDQLPTF
ncbi:MAG: DUF3892 domain-containing protein [Vallitaleaceae bacterium]|nr:DUF3892 domain-containing protein [Vallitaleaceae bacterium]